MGQVLFENSSRYCRPAHGYAALNSVIARTGRSGKSVAAGDCSYICSFQSRQPEPDSMPLSPRTGEPVARARQCLKIESGAFGKLQCYIMPRTA
jgi:hypothetical protein